MSERFGVGILRASSSDALRMTNHTISAGGANAASTKDIARFGGVKHSVLATGHSGLLSCVGSRWFGLLVYLLAGRGSEGDAHVFVDSLALVVVFRMCLAIRAGDGLGRFIGFEAEIAGFVFVGFDVVAEAVVAEH